MAFETFTSANPAARNRGRRLAISMTTAALFVSASVVAAARYRTKEERPKEDTIDVVLEKAPAPKPVAAPPPVAAPALLVPKTMKLNPLAPPPKPLEAPKEIPKDKPKEGDPKDDKGVAGVHEGGDTAGRQGGTGTATAAAPPPPPPPTSAPPPPPPPPKTLAIDESTEPPVPISQPRPPVPEELRKEGIESIAVVVRFVVTETGDVTDVTIVRGHPLLDAGVLAAVRSWKFKPATSQGRPVPFPKTVKIPFKLKT